MRPLCMVIMEMRTRLLMGICPLILTIVFITNEEPGSWWRVDLHEHSAIVGITITTRDTTGMYVLMSS